MAGTDEYSGILFRNMNFIYINSSFGCMRESHGSGDAVSEKGPPLLMKEDTHRCFVTVCCEKGLLCDLMF